MAYLDQKTLDKWRKEEVELHKRVITTYLYQLGLGTNSRNKFFILYDHYIDYTNILDYLYLPCQILVRCLVRGKLEEVKSYVQTRPLIKLKYSKSKTHRK